MSKVLIGHKVICLDDSLNIIAVYSKSNAHDQVLRSLGDFAVEAKEIRSFESLEAKVLVIEISVIDDCRVELIRVSHDTFVCSLCNHGRRFAVARVDIVVKVGDDRRELFLRLLMKIRNRNTCSKYGLVWVGDSHVGGGFSGLPIIVSKL